MQISLDDLQQKLQQAAQQYVSAEEAEYFAELLIDTHIKKAPRTLPLKSGKK